MLVAALAFACAYEVEDSQVVGAEGDECLVVGGRELGDALFGLLPEECGGVGVGGGLPLCLVELGLELSAGLLLCVEELRELVDALLELVGAVLQALWLLEAVEDGLEELAVGGDSGLFLEAVEAVDGVLLGLDGEGFEEF